MAQVFISYSSKDEAQAMAIVKQLESSKISCWIACRDIPVGGSFPTEIPPAIRNCPVFLLLLSRNSVQSDDVLSELSLAKRKYAQKKLIIPLMLEQFALPDEFDYHLANVQIRPYYSNPPKALEEAIGKIHEIVPQMIEPLSIGEYDAFTEKSAMTIASKHKLPEPAWELLSNFVLSKDNKPSAEVCYRRGKEYLDSKKYSNAVIWLRKAADMGHNDAQYWMGSCYYWGNGVPKNLQEAVE